jgi:uncharacterized repeat protein (TIGR03803 family)
VENMTSKRANSAIKQTLLVVAITLALLGSRPAAAQGKPQISVLYSFQGSPDGYLPAGALISDKAGNLYGTTVFGGRTGCSVGPGCGTVFELSSQTGSRWVETVLYSFQGGPKDGNFPTAGLIFDKAGNLYGTTSQGGSYSKRCNCGTVFELSPQAGGGWAEKLLISFNLADGAVPQAGVVFDRAGNLYGTTSEVGGRGKCNGNFGCGTAFELSPQAGGGWAEKVFHFNNQDGAAPLAGLIFDDAGNLFGTAFLGGSGGCTTYGSGCGVVFEITR